VRPVVKLQIVKLQIARHGAGAQKTGGISEARNNNDSNDNEMGSPRICTCHDRLPRCMPQEGPASAAASAAIRSTCSHRLVVGEPE